MLQTCSIHMIKDLVKGLQEHAHRSQLVYQQHIDILKGRLLDRDDQIETLNRQLSQYKGGELIFQKTDRDRKSSRGKDNTDFDECLRESRKSLSVLFRSKLEQFEQIVCSKSAVSRIEGKREVGDISQQQHKRLLNEIAHLRNDKQIYQRQLEAQGKLISQYEQENTEKVKQFKNYKLRSKQNSRTETKKIIDLYTEKYKQLSSNYSGFFRDLTSFIRNQLAALKQESMDSLTDTWETLTNSLVKFAQQLPYRSIQSRITSQQDSSILSRSEVLEFEIEQLRKELLVIKAENCVMKFQLKKKDEKKGPEPKTQPLFDKNKFFGESICQNEVRGSLRFQRSRKDTSRTKARRKDEQRDEEDRQEMTEIKERIRNLNNTDVGRRSGSKRKFGV